MIWYDIIWYHIIWYDIIWYHITAAAAAAAAAAALRCKGRRETFFRNFTLKNDLQKIEKYKKDPHENSVHFPYWIITRWYGFVPVMMNYVFDKNCIIISYLYFISYHHFLILGVVVPRKLHRPPQPFICYEKIILSYLERNHIIVNDSTQTMYVQTMYVFFSHAFLQARNREQVAETIIGSRWSVLQKSLYSVPKLNNPQFGISMIFVWLKFYGKLILRIVQVLKLLFLPF